MTKYHLNLAHLYGDLLNTYSDVGNIIALRYYAKQMDADIAVKVISIDEEFNPDEFDMALFGGGQDYEQLVVSKDLPNKKPESKIYQRWQAAAGDLRRLPAPGALLCWRKR